MNKPKKILIVVPAWVGDMVMAQVLFKALKQDNPDVFIDVLGPASTLALVRFMPEIREAIVLDIPHKKFGLWKRIKAGLILRGEKYDQAILLPNSWKSALVPFIASIPVRTGWLGEQRYGLLNDHRRLNKKEYPFLIERFAALAFKPGAPLPSLRHPQFEIPALAAAALKKMEIAKKGVPILALCPGAEYGPSKRWPAQYYAEVALQKLAQGWQVHLVGSAKEAEAAEIIQRYTNERCLNFVGKTSLGEAVTRLALADVVVSNDSGLMHIAAALNKSLVAIFGSSSPHYTPPLSERAHVLYLGLDCSPCFKRVCPLGHLNCLKELKPEKVLELLPAVIPETTK
jgi:heptosyltransferase-2